MKAVKYNKSLGSVKGRLVTVAGVTAISSVLMMGGGLANADAKTSTSAGSTSSSTSSNTKKSTADANQQQRLQNIISKGNSEINRRLTTLGTLTSKINSATKLTAGDKTSLSNEVSSTNSGLMSLEKQLDSDTTAASAHTDAKSIYTEYRVYAVVAPKVGLIKVADDQQVVQAKLLALETKLQSRIDALPQTTSNLATLKNDLSDMTAKTSAAQAISSNIENTVALVQPTDYNSNHSVLSSDNSQLKIARTDDQAATTDSKNIASALKSN